MIRTPQPRDSQTAVATLRIDSNEVVIEYRGERDHFPLQRMESGQLTADCLEQLTQRLRSLEGRALCILPGRGVSVRQFALPPTSANDVAAVLALKLEQELPLAPDNFAWGYSVTRAQRNGHTHTNGAAESCALVAALRRDALSQYDTIFQNSGLDVQYCLGVLLAAQRVEGSPGVAAILDVRSHSADLLLTRDGVPFQLRTFYTDGALAALSSTDSSTRSDSSLDRLAAELRSILSATELPAPERVSRLHVCAEQNSPMALEKLSGLLQISCESLPQTHSITASPLILETTHHAVTESSQRPPVPWMKWVAIWVVVLLAGGAARYLPPWLRAPHLRAHIETARQQLAQLPSVDGELAFLEYVEASQLGALDAVRVIADSSPPGTQITELSVAKSGAVTFSGVVQKPNVINDLRRKMTESGYFAGVPVITSQEQVKRKWHFRIVGQLAPYRDRPKPVPDPPVNKGAGDGPPPSVADTPPASSAEANATPTTSEGPQSNEAVSNHTAAAGPEIVPDVTTSDASNDASNGNSNGAPHDRISDESSGDNSATSRNTPNSNAVPPQIDAAGGVLTPPSPVNNASTGERIGNAPTD